MCGNLQSLVGRARGASGGGGGGGLGSGEDVQVWDGDRGTLFFPPHPSCSLLMNIGSKGAASGPGPPLSEEHQLSPGP